MPVADGRIKPARRLDPVPNPKPTGKGPCGPGAVEVDAADGV